MDGWLCITWIGRMSPKLGFKWEMGAGPEIIPKSLLYPYGTPNPRGVNMEKYYPRQHNSLFHVRYFKEAQLGSCLLSTPDQVVLNFESQIKTL